MKKILMVLVCLPLLTCAQTNLTNLIFRLIDTKDARNILENEGFKTTSINNNTDEYDIEYNEFKFSKKINFKKGASSTCYVTIEEYPGYSNQVSVKIYNKDFFNHFQNIVLKKSSYKETLKNVERNIIETSYQKNPLTVNLRESLNSYYKINVFNHRHKKKRESTYFKSNAIITSNKVNLRSEPSVNSKILGQLNKNDKIWIEEEKNIYIDNEFILKNKTTLYTNSKEYKLNKGKMVKEINSSVYYNGKYIVSDVNWVTVSASMDDKDIWGLIARDDISAAVSQTWFKIKTSTLSGWVYGSFVQKK